LKYFHLFSVPHQSETNQPARRRRTRTIFSVSAVKYMEQEFERGKYPDIRRREVIAAEIGVPEARVQVCDNHLVPKFKNILVNLLFKIDRRYLRVFYKYRFIFIECYDNFHTTRLFIPLKNLNFLLILDIRI
jgi:hypothetical protein